MSFKIKRDNFFYHISFMRTVLVKDLPCCMNLCFVSLKVSPGLLAHKLRAYINSKCCVTSGGRREKIKKVHL